MFQLISTVFFLCCLIQKAQAITPDSAEGRVYAVDIVRQDILTPGNTLSGEERVAAYTKACELKYYPACNYKTWTDEDGLSNPQKAGDFFSSRCKADGLSCVISGWANGFLNGKPSNKALAPSEAFEALSLGCTKKRYAPACAHLGEMYMMGVGTNIDYPQAQKLFQEACAAKDKYGCYLEGDLYYQGWGILQDYGVALQKYTEACEAEILEACVKQGQMIEYGQGQRQSDEKAERIYHQACEAGYTQGCVRLGRILHRKKGEEAAFEKTQRALERACAAKDKYGCYLGGDLYFDEWGEGEDYQLAEQRFVLGCQQGNMQSCFELGLFYEQGKSGRADPQKAYPYYEQACAKDNPSGCFYLARQQSENESEISVELTGFDIFKYLCGSGDVRGCLGMANFFEQGRGVQKDITASMMLAKNACDSGYAEGCSRLGEISLRASDVIELADGIEFLQRGCLLGDIEGCILLGKLYADGVSGAGISIEKDLVQAREIFTNTCNQGVGFGCYQQAKTHDAENDFQQARRLYQQGCEKRHSESCLILARRFQYGKGGQVDIPAAISFYKSGCALGEKQSCEQLGDFYASGERVEKDLRFALSQYQQACYFGSGKGCYLAGKMIREGGIDEADPTQALSFFQKGCDLKEAQACAESGSALFKQKYEAILAQAFESSACEVWLENKERPADNKKYVSVNKTQFVVHAGELQGREFTATKKEVNYLGTTTRTAQSIWLLQSEELMLDIEHHENWFHLKTNIRDFPRENSFSRDAKYGKSVYYSRDKNTIRRYATTSCGFADHAEVLKAQSCSEIQALIASQLVTQCR